MKLARPEVQDYIYVEDDEGLGPALAFVEGHDAIGVDTESNSMHAYRETVCLMQISTPDANLIFDTLRVSDLAPLAATFADPAIRKVFHGADYDVACLKRDYGFTFAGTFDTMVAGLLLADDRIGLADMVERFFGITLEKAHTKSNWGRRPLSPEQLSYLYEDTVYLVELAERMEERLARADLLEEASIEFRRVEEREPTERHFDPDGFFRIKGSRTLEGRALAVLKELFLFRENRSEQLDRPPFKVLANDTLLRIASRPPKDADALRSIRGVTDYVMRRFGSGVLDAVKKGMKAPIPERRRRRGEPTAPRLTPREQECFGRLKEWRRARAEGLGIGSVAVLPNHVLHDVIRARPTTEAELAAIPGVGARRAEKYAREILALFA